MGDQYKERYTRTFSAGAINAAASESFGNSQAAGDARAFQDQKKRWGSPNTLFITNNSAEVFEVLRDGVSTDTLGFVFPNGGVFSVKAEEGIHFDHVQLTNRSATNSSADEVKIRIGRSDQV